MFADHLLLSVNRVQSTFDEPANETDDWISTNISSEPLDPTFERRSMAITGVDSPRQQGKMKSFRRCSTNALLVVLTDRRLLAE